LWGKRGNQVLTIGDALRSASARRRGKTALVFGEERLSYGELDRRVNQFAHALYTLGAEKGDRVALLLPNGLWMAIAYFGVARAGMVAVPINLRWTAPEIAYVLADADVRLVLADEDFRGALPAAPHILVGRQWQDAVDRASAADLKVGVQDTDPWVIVYTSGTTGRPKGAVRDHRSNLLIALVLATELSLTADDVGMALLPMFHVNSMWFVTLSCIIGTTCVIYPHRTFHPGHIVEAFNAHRVTYSMFVPSMLAMLADAAERGALEPSHLRVALTSSAPLDLALRDRLLARFPRARLFDIYGATEYGAVTLMQHAPDQAVGSVGWPVVGASVRILDEDGHELPANAVGEVYVAAPSLMTEYWRNPDATRAALQGRYLTLGDMGYLDDDGRLWLSDRKQDMIIVAGENVYPREVEDVLLAHPGLMMAAAVGQPDAVRGQVVVAAVVPMPGVAVDVEALREACRAQLADYKRPREIRVVEQLPTGPTGKVVRRLVRDGWSTLA
jgi:acyl-CoA synthetase (AMP-forming)/AMP-acid ligase II